MDDFQTTENIINKKITMVILLLSLVRYASKQTKLFPPKNKNVCNNPGNLSIDDFSRPKKQKLKKLNGWASQINN